MTPTRPAAADGAASRPAEASGASPTPDPSALLLPVLGLSQDAPLLALLPLGVELDVEAKSLRSSGRRSLTWKLWGMEMKPLSHSS